MLRLRVLTLAGCVVAFGALCLQAQDNADLKAILRKSIVAHGGADKLSKFGAATSKFKGTIEIMGKSRDITGESTLQKPDKLKTSLRSEEHTSELQSRGHLVCRLLLEKKKKKKKKKKKQ